MIFDRLKKAGVKWAKSPGGGMKLAMDPRVQKVVMAVLQLPSNIRNRVQQRTSQFAAYADLVTRSDVQQLNRTIRELERELRRVQRQVREEKERLEAARDALQKAGGGNGDVAAAAPEASATGEETAVKPKVAVKKKVAIGKKKDA